MNRLIAAVILLGLATPLQAQDAVAPAPAQAAPAEPAEPGPPIVVEGQKEKKICRNATATGSIMSRRVCKTASQMAREEAEAQQALDRARAARETQDLTQELRNAG